MDSSLDKNPRQVDTAMGGVWVFGQPDQLRGREMWKIVVENDDLIRKPIDVEHAPFISFYIHLFNLLRSMSS